MTDAQAPDQNAQPNHMRKGTKYLWAFGGAGAASTTLAVLLQMNGFYTTKEEGIAMKENIARVEKAAVDAQNKTKDDIITAMNEGFGEIKQLLKEANTNQATINRLQDKENRDFAIQIENLKFVLGIGPKNSKPTDFKN